MRSDSDVGQADHCAIDMWKVDPERLTSMRHKISENPRLLSREAGKISCCIFRVPPSLMDANEKAYKPSIVSIGPHYLGESHLSMIQEHKWRYLASLLSRTHSTGLSLENLLKEIASLESESRKCYSETIDLNSHDFIEMMVLDGCFIVELFRKVAGLVPFECDDPLDKMAWILPSFCQDFLKLENQIPFIVLQRLFDLSNLPGEQSTQTLSSLALQFFKYSSLNPKVIAQQSNIEGKHLLQLVRSSFIPSDLQTEPERDETHESRTSMIHCISMLRRAGIEIKQGKNDDSFLHVTFKGGVIEMPTITVDEFMSSFLLNCVAFEQCYGNCPKLFTTYVTLLDCLIDTYSDVEYLCDKNIIEHYLGKEEEVANFINNTGKDVAVNLDSCYLSQLFTDVNQHYQNGWHVHWASFKYTYFNTPWSFISALAAFVLLVLTIAQAYIAAYQFFGQNSLSKARLAWM